MLRKIEFYQIRPGDLAVDLAGSAPWTVERVQATTTIRKNDFSESRGSIGREWIGWTWYREVADAVTLPPLPATTAFIPPCECGKCTDCR
jgi:hypothetical protein